MSSFLNERIAAIGYPSPQSCIRKRTQKTANDIYVVHVRPINPTGVRTMEEILCNVELVKENNDFVVRIQSDLGGVREYKSMNFEEVLDQMVQDLQEEFETF